MGHDPRFAKHRLSSHHSDYWPTRGGVFFSSLTRKQMEKESETRAHSHASSWHAERVSLARIGGHELTWDPALPQGEFNTHALAKETTRR